MYMYKTLRLHILNSPRKGPHTAFAMLDLYIVPLKKRETVTLAVGQAHIALLCLCLCMSNCTVPKCTSSYHVGAKEVCRA